ncbi:bifunctional 4-hydroxy-2-oxoglutarate aldolase/2-dehydro-3-deoxy-phosphogluconate aldolase [Actinotalea sp. Marseille-Q4924]|uniref:bifunctional 4-hydroxy-2-oxoglutarate aldolase/2-dehydro-3-deoxy-phosphogluconate aldolase n=1 Tax=Actinotalea sp. Marseille-Q4924 TaxID=2866571 RepID=UPI001CE49717|nr:bifunctional 4-hydroxy-2-oxoglutarate aldolase/2-dehydro-3-deoxy-phosphogluconate aldolase [Actinotalea sp. Marseille-Q4924]
MTEDLIGRLTAARVLAIIRGRDADASVTAALTLFDEGVELVEVSLTSRDALAVIRSVRDRAPEGCRIGAGTVLTAQAAADAADAGAQFVVTPAVTPSIEAALELGLPVLAGALTPTEAWAAMDRGACAVKLFPASAGGPAYLRSLRDPLPTTPFVAVGGVGIDDVVPYLEAGAVAVGVGGPLIGDAASGGDLERLRERARAYLEVVRGSSA